jgi:alkylhydroperoxidase family enzyme
VPHISLGNDAPGIVSLFAYRPETAKPLCDLAEVLLRGPSSLTRGERELIASYVSTLNDCNFCADSHAAFAAAQLPEGMTLVDQVRADPASAPVSAKLGALLRIAGAVQRSGQDVRTADVAAAFCLFNRYVDGLATTLPEDPGGYAAMAELIVSVGYGAASGEPAGQAH